ncbi:hypothetical protein TrCOL_g7413 [Triparma columacea]|uniref:Tubby C-terminal domain-containing protein n=1 Tax=Triparma columacea TaxID=722753 RepID=A0A9W7L1D7_9STRA|nr:hypothetical protein TrCOL_g7413 [Triparma columacea]
MPRKKPHPSTPPPSSPTLVHSIPPTLSTLSSYLAFIKSVPASRTAIYRMVIIREKSYISGATFTLCFDPPPQSHAPPAPSSFRVLARRKRLPKAYLISLDKDDLRTDAREDRSKYYLGKIKIKSGDEYVQHDRGINPNRLLDVDIDEGTDEEEKEQTAEEKEADQHMDELLAPRHELSSVYISTNDNLDRVINVSIPTVTGTGEEATCHVFNGTTRNDKITHNARQLVERGSRNDLMKDQIYILSGHENPSLCAGTSDYYGRRILDSEKNFLVSYTLGGDPPPLASPPPTTPDPSSATLQMNRIRKNTWAVQFTYPMTPLQAFGVCLTRFE